jgi:hypothetical protein
MSFSDMWNDGVLPPNSNQLYVFWNDPTKGSTELGLSKNPHSHAHAASGVEFEWITTS